MSYLNIIIKIDVDNMQGFINTIDSLKKQTVLLSNERLILIMPNKYKFDIDFGVLETLKNNIAECEMLGLPVNCLWGVSESQNYKTKMAVKQCEMGYILFMDSGDTVDTHFFEYVSYFNETYPTDNNLIFVKNEFNNQNLHHELKERNDSSNSNYALVSSYKGVLIPVKKFKQTEIPESICLLPDSLYLLYVINDIILSGTNKYFFNTAAFYCNEFTENYSSIEFELYRNQLLKNLNEENLTLSKVAVYIEDLRLTKGVISINGSYKVSSGQNGTQLLMTYNLSEVTAEQKVTEDEDGGIEIDFTLKVPEMALNNEYIVSFILKVGESVKYEIHNVDYSKISSGKVKNFKFFTTEYDGVYRFLKVAQVSAYKVSVIIPIYNVEKYLEEAIESVVAQTIGFKNIQLILVNDGSPDNSEAVCMKYLEKYPQNVVYLKQENAGVSAARNLGMDYIVGEYTCMLDGDDKYEKNFMEECIKFFEKHKGEIDVIVVPMKFFEARIDLHPLAENLIKHGTGIVDCEKRPELFTLHTTCGMFDSEAIKDVRYDTKLKLNEDSLFVAKVKLKKMKYGIVTEVKFLYRRRLEETSAVQRSRSNINYYDKFSLFHKLLIDYSLERFGYVPQYIQHVVMYDLQWYSGELSEEVKPFIDINKIFEILKYIILNIDNSIIKSQKLLDYWIKAYLLKLKNDEAYLNEEDNLPKFYFGEMLFEQLGGNVWVQIIEEKNKIIYFGGCYALPTYNYTKLIIKVGENVYECNEHLSFHKKVYYLGEVVHTSMQFDIYIPFIKNCAIEFYFRTQSGRIIPVKLRKTASCHMPDLPNSFFIGDTTIIKSTSISNIFYAEKKSFESIKFYLNVYANSLFKGEDELISEYIRNYEELSKKRIWIFIDRVNEAGDNAEVLFQYCQKIDDGIEKYFVISAESQYYSHIKDSENILEFGSFKHKLLFLFAEKLISSHTFEDKLFYFKNNATVNLVKSLVCFDEIFLSHGIMKIDLSGWANRYYKNLSLFMTSSHQEYASVFEYPYEYNNDVVKLTGLPRFDVLKNNPEKIILFMPTWRKSLVNADRSYNERFKHTEYFKCLNDFINDERLIAALKIYDYKLYFKPHPRTIQQNCDFNVLPEVSIIDSEITYDKMFEIGALCITDFSSVEFDFAYLKKPIIYYQKVPNHYEVCYFDYESMGFGDIFHEQEALVDKIIETIENGCAMEEKYKERVDNFFAFNDRNNCERVYNEIMKLPVRNNL